MPITRKSLLSFPLDTFANKITANWTVVVMVRTLLLVLQSLLLPVSSLSNSTMAKSTTLSTMVNLPQLTLTTHSNHMAISLRLCGLAALQLVVLQLIAPHLVFRMLVAMFRQFSMSATTSQLVR
jgi:hypothetical protein